MDPSLIGLVELVVVFLLVVAFAVWQLRDVARARRGGRPRPDRRDEG